MKISPSSPAAPVGRLKRNLYLTGFGIISKLQLYTISPIFDYISVFLIRIRIQAQTFDCLRLFVFTHKD
ncbi:unknown [Bacteroides sp. CAG:709]|nr:unknown [Bacteroides sp. CAG:709]